LSVVTSSGSSMSKLLADILYFVVSTCFTVTSSLLIVRR
jgi:hypothetical protein